MVSIVVVGCVFEVMLTTLLCSPSLPAGSKATSIFPNLPGAIGSLGHAWNGASTTAFGS